MHNVRNTIQNMAKYLMNFKRITWEYYLYRPMICLWINDDYVIGIAHFGTGWIDPADFCCTAQSPIHHLHRNCREIIILYRYTSHFIIEIQIKRWLLVLLRFVANEISRRTKGCSNNGVHISHFLVNDNNFRNDE